MIVPYLRGYGTTRFLSESTNRNGQQAALGADVIALMDALKIPRAVIGGYDWGARTANIVAALNPDRCNALSRREAVKFEAWHCHHAQKASILDVWLACIATIFMGTEDIARWRRSCRTTARLLKLLPL